MPGYHAYGQKVIELAREQHVKHRGSLCAGFITHWGYDGSTKWYSAQCRICSFKYVIHFKKLRVLLEVHRPFGNPCNRALNLRPLDLDLEEIDSGEVVWVPESVSNQDIRSVAPQLLLLDKEKCKANRAFLDIQPLDPHEKFTWNAF